MNEEDERETQYRVTITNQRESQVEWLSRWLLVTLLVIVAVGVLYVVIHAVAWGISVVV